MADELNNNHNDDGNSKNKGTGCVEYTSRSDKLTAANTDTTNQRRFEVLITCSSSHERALVTRSRGSISACSWCAPRKSYDWDYTSLRRKTGGVLDVEVANK